MTNVTFGPGCFMIAAKPPASGDAPAGAFRRFALAGALSTAAIAVLAAALVLLLTSVLTLRQTSAALARAIENERSLVQTIAALCAQDTSGDPAVRSDLRVAIGTLATIERQAKTGASIATYLADARRIAALPPGDPRTAALAAPIERAARRPIPDRLEAALRAADARIQAQLAIRRLGTIAVSLALLATLMFQGIGVIAPAIAGQRRLLGELAALSHNVTTDPLTGTLNRRSFQDRGAVEIHKANRYARPLSLLMIDPDHLDPINETHGSGAGDTLLCALTQLLFSGTRVTDLVGRVGIDEFAVLLPETDLAGAELLAERLRRRIGDLSVPVDDAVITCTVSIGVTAAEKDAVFFGPTLARADAALYEAKMRGRNRVYVKVA